ncbi:uncharacterized protein YjbK [Cytobacillus eiseniae]|uniref:Uncharacterized protein YjbK n=1 Tax=Cytobacillus eiseniae TaxID=762947 RepID=A0ABS4RE59_9BACI|nr:CYTH domain-containing protein [Cytobacillus eiseniae]MBP2241186.1 uncharacterized protein YjbK [Cytobacillus eiseniae]
MSQNIEIEFKNMITKQEFEKVKQFFAIKEIDFFTQENHYFDTPDFALKEQGSALRIRKKADQYELTLKQPHPDGLLETNENLDAETANQIFANGHINNEKILSILTNMSIDPKRIRYFGSLTTKRAEIAFQEGLLVLDNSYYLTIEDFEIEYEVSNREKGEAIFLALLEKLSIPIRQTENKIKRFYFEKYKQDYSE